MSDEDNLEKYHKHTRYRKTNDETLGQVLTRLIAAYGHKDKYYQARLRNYWADMMGPTITKHTRELRIRKNGHLYIMIGAASLRQELTFAKEKIKINLNEALGEDYIQEVHIL